MSENVSPGGIFLPNNTEQPVLNTAMSKAVIGGTEVDYFSDPRLATMVKPETLQSAELLIGLLSGMLNVQHALMREVVLLRKTVVSLLPDDDDAAVTVPDGSPEDAPDGEADEEPGARELEES